MKPIDYKLIHALDAVVKTKSFDKAASLLNITQSAVSQRIKQLESFVAQPVLVRGSPLSATILGQTLLRHFAQVKLLENELADQLFPNESTSIVPISIAVNADSLANWFIPSLAVVLKKYPIELHLQVCDELRTKELLRKGEVYAALSCQAETFTGCKVQEIGKVDYILCATPDFVRHYFKQGLTQASLQHAPGVEFDQHDTMHCDYIAKHFGLRLGDYPCHVVRSSEAFVTMALAGVAYCLLPHFQAQPYLQNGTLVDLMPADHLSRTMYWHTWVLERGVYKMVSQSVVEYGRTILHS